MDKNKAKDSICNDPREFYRVSDADQALTTNQGVKISDNQNTLKAGERGPSLLEDFIMREKITHFDHERIPERVVHARGEGAHGYFQVYQSLAEYTTADFLQDPQKKTPVFVRFSTVAGSRGSADLVRDVRGFAVKFYTEAGIFDLVGNNIPIFFIQDAIKFPDLIHAVKPEPHNEIPQAASAHDTFWDFVSMQPEIMHMIMWIMSDRAIPRSFSMMEGFGVHTFRLINKQGKMHFVKFHWKPVAGLASVVWDEAQQINGRDGDFHRRDLWEAIERGQYPEWELGLQIIPEEDENKFPFDLLDATKIVPEEMVSVKKVGKLVLNRNPDNFFAETEQVAFHPGHLVPGIDFTNDPLLQGRLFSYTDTQLLRLGGANFHEIPINRGICPFHNNQRDGMHRQTINVGSTSYDINSLAQGFPRETPGEEGGFVSYPQKITGDKIRKRSASFSDHFSQATLFWNSQTATEQQHIVDAFRFELGKVTAIHVRENVLKLLVQVDKELALRVAEGLGLKIKDTTAASTVKLPLHASSALSIEKNYVPSVRGRKIAILAETGAKLNSILDMQQGLEAAGAVVEILAATVKTMGEIGGILIAAKHSFKTMPAVFFDGAFIAAGDESNKALVHDPDALEFIDTLFKHFKPLAVQGEGVKTLEKAIAHRHVKNLTGIVIAKNGDTKSLITDFIEAIKKYRHWDRV